MGAWGEAVFENDVAEDWVDQLASGGTVHFLTRPLRTVIKAGPGEVLEADQCAEALAATSKDLVAANKCMSLDIMEDEFNKIKGAVMIVYPMGLPPSG